MAGIDYTKLHEKESVYLALGRRVPVAELRKHFIEAGFTEQDDFFFLPRLMRFTSSRAVSYWRF